jgi:AAA15 family ATPase/GTPase
MMLNSLVIKNFRMLEDFTVEKLGRVNLIVGKNNSGKSTVLEALRIFAGCGHHFVLDRISETRDETTPFIDKTDLYRGLFTDRKYENKHIFIGESINKEGLSFSVRFTEKFIPIIVTNNEVINNYYHEEPKELFCELIPTQFISMEELKKDWEDNIYMTKEEDISRALKIITPNFQQLGFYGQTPNLFIKVKLENESKPVPLKSLGDGMLRILQIAIKLVSAQGGFLLIDEFENGLHYSVQENVWRLLFEMAEKLDIQVFATTHSWDCIESFATIALEKPETEGVLFRMGKSVGKSDYGKVISTVFSGDDLSYITQSNMEIR